MIKRIFSAPRFDDEEQNARARFLNGTAWIIIGLVIVASIPIAAANYQDFTLPILAGIVAAFAAALFLLRRGYVNFAAIFVVAIVWLAISFQAFTADGVRDVIVIGYLALAMLASLTINMEAAVIVLTASIGAIWSLAVLQTKGGMTPSLDTPVNYARDLSIMFFIVASLIYFVTTTLGRALKQARASASETHKTNMELQSLQATLEKRIEERTAELNESNRHNERRAKQFEAIAQVARATASNQELESLLTQLTEVISNQFGFYHTGIFLIDENSEFAVLRASNSEGGRRMLARKHQLKIGQTGIVGHVSAVGKPRIALDVGMDAAYFDNPDLPNTRSEMALPLRIAEQIIGVLDVQSTEPNAFQAEDIEVLSTLADQVSIAIQNSHSYDAMQELLREAQRASGAFRHEAWRAFQSQEGSIGYQIAGNQLRPLIKPVTSAQIKKAVASKETIKESGAIATLAVPIRLRDEVIGVMDIRVPEEHHWDPDEVDIAEAVAERLSLALEASLLLKSTQRQAEIERLTAEISSKIGATTQFDSILRTAAEELSRALGSSEVLVQLHRDVLEEHTEQ